MNRISQSFVLIAMTAMAASAQPPVNPEWKLINPVMTGVPGWTRCAYK